MGAVYTQPVQALIDELGRLPGVGPKSAQRIAFYLLKKKRNLVRPMWVGDKPLLPSVPASNDHAMTRALAAALFALCAGGVAWLVSLGG